MLTGTRDFMREGLGVPDFARADAEPSGLSGWWDALTEAGQVGHGWSPLAPLRASAVQWAQDHGEPEPTDTALGAFLRSRVPTKRERIGDRRVAMYRIRVPEAVDAVGRGSNRPPYTCKRDGNNPVQPRPLDPVEDPERMAIAWEGAP